MPEQQPLPALSVTYAFRSGYHSLILFYIFSVHVVGIATLESGDLSIMTEWIRVWHQSGEMIVTPKEG